MESFIDYVLQVWALQAGMVVVFFIFLHKSQSFQFNRYYLLASLTLPFVVPFIKIPVNTQPIMPPVFQDLVTPFSDNPIQDISLSTQVTATGQDLEYLYSAGIFMYVLLLIVSVGIMLYGIRKVQKLTRQSVGLEQSTAGYSVYSVPLSMLSFSFLNKIFISNSYYLSQPQRKAIIRHEEFHLKQFHSLDLVLAEAIRALLLFSPVVWVIQRKLAEVHEYLADRHTIKHCDEQEYIGLLRSFQWQETTMKWGNPYLGSSIKKRIHIMKNPAKAFVLRHFIAPTLIVSAMFWLFSCEENQESETPSAQVEESQFVHADIEAEISDRLKALGDSPEDYIQAYVSLQRKHPENIYLPCSSIGKETDLESSLANNKLDFTGFYNKPAFHRQLTDEEMAVRTAQWDVKPDPSVKIFLSLLVADRVKYQDYARRSHWDDAIYEDVDVPPAFDGGPKALQSFINENLKWNPTSAIDKDFHDSLIISFVVNKGGGLVYTNVEKDPATTDEDLKYSMMKAAYALMDISSGLWIPALRSDKYVFSRHSVTLEFTAATASKF